MNESEYRTVRLTEDAYQELERRRKPDETVSDTVVRIAGGRSLLDLTGIVTEDEGDRMRRAIDDRSEQTRDRLDSFVQQHES